MICKKQNYFKKWTSWTSWTSKIIEHDLEVKKKYGKTIENRENSVFSRVDFWGFLENGVMRYSALERFSVVCFER